VFGPCRKDIDIRFKIYPPAPSVERLRALRVNDTAFNFTLEVFYTGGGDLEQFSIQLQQSGSGTFTTLTSVTPVQSQTSPRLWYAVVVNPNEFDGLEDPRFNVIVVNAMQQSVPAPVSGEVGTLISTHGGYIKYELPCVCPHTYSLGFIPTFLLRGGAPGRILLYSTND
jgi:hypothetical protein